MRPSPPPLIQLSLLAIALSTLASAADAVTLGQSDDFESGTQGWSKGASALSVSSPGPEGNDDDFLLISTDVRPNVVALNDTSWAGDYVAAGVTGLTLSAINLGPSELQLRAAFGNVGGGPSSGGTWFASTEAFTLAPGSGWQQLSLSLLPDALTRVAGDEEALQVLQSVTALRLLHAVIPDGRGDSSNSPLGVDGITAVPEPGTGTLVLIGTALAGAGRRRNALRVSC